MKDRASLVLMEQLIMLLVFTLAAALCLRTFAQADSLSRETGHRDQAAFLAQNAAEQLKNNCGDAEAFLKDLGGFSENGRWILCYDTNGKPVSETAAYYRMVIQDRETGNDLLGSAEIYLFDISKQEKPLYSLTVHWQEGLQ